MSKKTFPEFKPLKPGEPIEIRLVGKPVPEQYWTDKPKKQAPLTKSYKPSECPACKLFASLKHAFELPVYGADQLPEVDHPRRIVHLYEGSPIYDAVKAAKPKWLVEDEFGWYNFGGTQNVSE